MTTQLENDDLIKFGLFQNWLVDYQLVLA